jgi:hypothetical protein
VESGCSDSDGGVEVNENGQDQRLEMKMEMEAAEREIDLIERQSTTTFTQ